MEWTGLVVIYRYCGGCSRGHGRRHSTASTAQTVNTMLDTTLPTLDIPDTAVVMSFPFTSPREPGSYVRNNSGTTHTPLEFFSMIELLMLWKTGSLKSLQDELNLFVDNLSQKDSTWKFGKASFSLIF